MNVSLLQEGMDLAVSMSGLVAMVASLRIIATVMVMPPVSSLSVSAVQVRMETSHGILNSAAPLSLPPTALVVADKERGRLLLQISMEDVQPHILEHQPHHQWQQESLLWFWRQIQN